VNRFVDEQSQRVANLVQVTGERARKIPGIGVLEQTLQAYNEDRGSLFAAALSYYALLSIFPFMLFLLAASSPFLQSEEAIRAVAGAIGGYFPTGPQVIRTTLHEVTQLRGALSIAAAAGFLWSASGVFNILQLAINRAFRVQRQRPVWRERIVSLGMVIVASLLFGASFLNTTAMRLALHYGFVSRHDLLVQYFQIAAGIVVGVLIFGLIYRYVPFDSGVRWRDVWLSAVLAAVLWEIAKLAFAWYLTNLALLNLVYGSVGAIIALMLWSYITAVIMLMCAELAAVRAGVRSRERTGKEWWAATALSVSDSGTDQYSPVQGDRHPRTGNR
jgi:membrane protein